MKIIDVVSFSLGIGFFIIGIYEATVVGVLYSYWWFMLSAGLLLFYTYRKRSQEYRANQEQKLNKKKPTKGTKSRR